MRKHLWILGLLAASLPATGLCQDMVLDVSPLRVLLHVLPGAEYTDAISVSNTGSKPVRLRTYLSDWTLDEEGTPSFRDAGTTAKTSAPWVDLAPSDFLLEPTETENVRFTIQVPEDMLDGGYHCALMLETVPMDRAEQGIPRVFVLGRVACMLYVTVGNAVRSARITSLSAGIGENGALLDLIVANTGEDFIRLAGDARLVVKGHESGDFVELPDVPVLPGGSRHLVLELPNVPQSESTLARVTIDLPKVGVLIGECPLFFDKAERTDP